MRARLWSASLILVALGAAACGGRDAEADTSAVSDAVMVGVENISVVTAQQLRSGPTLSGAIAPERSATVRAEVPAVVVEFDKPGVNLRIIGDHTAAIAQTAEHFRREEAVGTGSAEGSGILIAIAGTQGLCRVFQDRQMVFASEGHQRLHIADASVEVYGH